MFTINRHCYDQIPVPNYDVGNKTCILLFHVWLPSEMFSHLAFVWLSFITNAFSLTFYRPTNNATQAKMLVPYLSNQKSNVTNGHMMSVENTKY